MSLYKLILLILNCYFVKSEVQSICSDGDTEWNRKLIGAHLRYDTVDTFTWRSSFPCIEHFRYWITSIILKNDTSENFRIEFKENVKSPGDDDAQTRLDFITRKEKETGKYFGPAWKNFGYKGPRYHDGFLYGELDEKLHMTGTLSICFDLSISFCSSTKQLEQYITEY